jgi:hypothetical protein
VSAAERLELRDRPTRADHRDVPGLDLPRPERDELLEALGQDHVQAAARQVAPQPAEQVGGRRPFFERGIDDQHHRLVRGSPQRLADRGDDLVEREGAEVGLGAQAGDQDGRRRVILEHLLDLEVHRVGDAGQERRGLDRDQRGARPSARRTGPTHELAGRDVRRDHGVHAAVRRVVTHFGPVGEGLLVVGVLVRRGVSQEGERQIVDVLVRQRELVVLRRRPGLLVGGERAQVLQRFVEIVEQRQREPVEADRLLADDLDQAVGRRDQHTIEEMAPRPERIQGGLDAAHQRARVLGVALVERRGRRGAERLVEARHLELAGPQIELVPRDPVAVDVDVDRDAEPAERLDRALVHLLLPTQPPELRQRARLRVDQLDLRRHRHLDALADASIQDWHALALVAGQIGRPEDLAANVAGNGERAGGTVPDAIGGLHDEVLDVATVAQALQRAEDAGVVAAGRGPLRGRDRVLGDGSGGVETDAEHDGGEDEAACGPRGHAPFRLQPTDREPRPSPARVARNPDA